MPLTIPDFWRLLQESQLLNADECRQLGEQYAAVSGSASAGNAKSLAQWLISNHTLSRYQATLLLAGRPGPFFYGEYRVYDRITEGPFSGCFRATHEPTGHPVQLRFLSGPMFQSGTAWEKAVGCFLQQRAVQHPHLQQVHELVDVGSHKFLVVEALDGSGMDEELQDDQGLGPAEACRGVCFAALALGAMHQQGLVHGDLRPARILFEENGNVRLLRDPFFVPRPPDLMRPDPSGQWVLRADYVAPEVAQGMEYGPLADIYALGCTLYHLLSGRPPFDGGDLASKFERHATEAIRPLDDRGVPKPLTQAVAYMMAKNPRVRYQQVDVVVEQLGRFMEGSPTPVAFPPPSTLAPYVEWTDRQLAAAAAEASRPPAAAPLDFDKLPVADTELDADAVATLDTGNDEPRSAAVNPSIERLRRRREQQRKRNLIIAAGLLILAIPGGILAWTQWGPDGGSETQASGGPGGGEATPGSTEGGDGVVGPAAGGDAAPFVRVADDGEHLWEPPTWGSPVSLDYVAPGAQIFVQARPSELLAHPEGLRAWRAMGPAFADASQRWESAAGVTFGEIERLLVSLYPDEQRMARPAYVVRLKEPLPRDELLERWGRPAEETVGEKLVCYRRGDWLFHLPEEDDQLVVIAEEPEMRDIAEFDGAPPALRREMARLLQASDSDRHVNVLFAPNHLFSELFRDGRELYLGEPRKVREPLAWFFADGLKAVLLSVHLDQQCYVELRAYGQADYDSHTLAQDFRSRLEEVPDAIETYIARLNPAPYWRLVAFRFPAMIRFLHDQSRIGVENDQAVLNVRLPDMALHNLVFGAEMALASEPSMGSFTTGSPESGGPTTMEELLGTPIPLAFDQKSLEFAMRDLGIEIQDRYPNLDFPFRVKILGADLMDSSITRNQQIVDFNAADQPLSDVLTALVLKANPVPTESPADPEQALVWVVGPDPDQPEESIILITTRKASAEKGYDLPEPFQIPDP